MAISQLYVLSPRGNRLAFKDYRRDVPSNSDEVFFRKYKNWDGEMNQAGPGDCPPFFCDGGVHYCCVKRRQLLFVSTTRENAAPAAMAETMSQMVSVVTDYLGVLSEDAIRGNFTLVYELWDEMIDLGFTLEMNTERLRPFIFHDVAEGRRLGEQESLYDRLLRGELGDRVKSADAAAVSVVDKKVEERNEVFVDVIERLSATVDCTGNVVSSEVDGALVLKSFLAGSPTVYLSLSDDLVVGGSQAVVRARYASAVLDSVAFDSATDASRFDKERVVTVQPPLGETTVLSYRATSVVKMPFRLVHSLILQSPQRGELALHVHAELPAGVAAICTRVALRLPGTTSHASFEGGDTGSGHTFEYRQETREMCWNIPRITGTTTNSCRVFFSSTAPIDEACRREVGPVCMYFEIPQHTSTGLAVKQMNIVERGNASSATRWIRGLTQANSFVFRLH